MLFLIKTSKAVLTVSLRSTWQHIYLIKAPDFVMNNLINKQGIIWPFDKAPPPLAGLQTELVSLTKIAPDHVSGNFECPTLKYTYAQNDISTDWLFLKKNTTVIQFLCRMKWKIICQGAQWQHKSISLTRQETQHWHYHHRNKKILQYLSLTCELTYELMNRAKLFPTPSPKDCSYYMRNGTWRRFSSAIFYPTLVYNVMNLRPSRNQELWPFLPIIKILVFHQTTILGKNTTCNSMCSDINILSVQKSHKVPHILNLFFTPFYSMTVMCTIQNKQSHGPVLGLDLLIE